MSKFVIIIFTIGLLSGLFGYCLKDITNLGDVFIMFGILLLIIDIITLAIYGGIALWI